MPVPALLLVALSAAPPRVAARQESPGAEADLAFFESQVRPLLVEHCYECHSDRKKRPKGGLRLDSRAGWAAGGESGPALVPGDVEKSLLVSAVRYGDKELEMPPTGKLPDAAIAVLEEWVRRGAPDPRVAGATSESVAPAKASASTHWAFQRMADPEPPPVRETSWPRNEIDRFVLARLEAEGLAHAPEADRRTLLRRASYDLLGLPPANDELERFANDPAPDAWEQELERLLASPHYGERWGRHWLDLARYADSNGLDENLAMSNAWRYRDWVVRALDADLPYDRFVTLQLAGDLLPEPADEHELADQLVATGFLVLGPKMLAEQDKVKLELDVVDEQLDVTSQALLGLTMGCARCHDHKFDPIPQRDYYALAGIFKSTRTMANLDFVSRWNERELAPRARIEQRAAELAALEQSRTKTEELHQGGASALLARWHGDFAQLLLAANEASERSLYVEAEDFSRGNLLVDREQHGTKSEPIVRTHEPGAQFVEYDLTFAAPAVLRLELRYASESARPVRVLLDGAVVAEAALSEPTGGWGLASQRWSRAALLDVRAGRNVLRLEREADFPHVDRLLLVPASSLEDDAWLGASPYAAGLPPALLARWVEVLERTARANDPVFGVWHAFAALPRTGPAGEFEARAAALQLELRSRREALAPNALVATLLDGLPPASLRELATRYQALFAAVDQAWTALKASAAGKDKTALDDPAQEELRVRLGGPEGPYALRRDEVEGFFDAARRDELAAEYLRLAEREKALTPAFERALAVQDAAKKVELPIHVRGSHLNLGPEPIPRGVPGLTAAVLPAPVIPAESSGRLELARWITDGSNPLTARVLVNRVWAGHFGAGLVRTPSNFGLRGETPSHPELLDWLARRFVRDGWSLKALHRLVMSSATYRMSSVPTPEALARDPENRLLARQARRRLDAEAVRDYVLARSGTLELTLGGNLLSTKDGDYVTNDQSGDQGRYESPRRSLYLPIVRNSMYDLFAAFDYRDPSLPIDQRSSSTAPAQALWLMNSPLVVDQSKHVADELAARAPEPDARVVELYRRVLGRAPDERERGLALAFLERASAPVPVANSAVSGADPARGWQALVQALFLTNEFLYVD